MAAQTVLSPERATPLPPSGRLRRAGLLALAGTALLGRPVLAAAPALPQADDLPQALAQALARRQPLVVMVSLDGCPFCKVVRENYLMPLLREGASVVQVDQRSTRQLTSLQGEHLSHDAMVRQWRVRVAPTVLFFGRQGQEVAERLVGASIPDFYGAYLDQRLQQATATLR